MGITGYYIEIRWPLFVQELIQLKRHSTPTDAQHTMSWPRLKNTDLNEEMSIRNKETCSQMNAYYNKSFGCDIMEICKSIGEVSM